MKYFMIPNLGSMSTPAVRKHPYWMVLPWQLETELGMRSVAEHSKLPQAHDMLDNGAYESQPIPNHRLIELAKQSGVPIVVAPDQIGATATVSRSNQIGFLTLNIHPAHQMFMYCLAGCSQREVLLDAEWAFDFCDPHRVIIGIGAAYYQWCKTDQDRQSELPRLRMLMEILRIADRLKSAHWLHILGARWSAIRAYSEIQNTPGHNWELLGIDTEKPFACALGGTLYPERPEVTRVHNDTRKPNIRLLKDNIAAFCEAYGLEQPNGLS